MNQGVQTSVGIPTNNKVGLGNASQTGNRVSVYNAQSWNPETHPEGRGDSYVVQDITYDDGKLDVTYRDGFKAQYDGITPQEARDFAQADSKGRWAHAHLWDLPYKEIK